MKAAKISYSGPSGERRQFPRRVCAIEAELTADGYLTGRKVRVTDISLGGCYVEMLTPLPKDSSLEFHMKLDDEALHVFGKVRSSQAGFGMGVGFTSMGARDFEALQRYAPGGPQVAPPLPAVTISDAADDAGRTEQPARSALDSLSPQTANLDRFENAPSGTSASASAVAQAEDTASVAETLQAVVDLLERKGLLTREELFEEVERVKRQKR